MKNKIIFMGTPDFAGYILQELMKNQFNIVAVITQPDKKVGRKQQIEYSNVKKIAINNQIQLFQPKQIESIVKEIEQLNPDLVITAAYGQILPKKFLNIPRLLCINVHGSLLPKYRGGAPVQHAILNGDKKTGITIIKMEQKMDAGAMLMQKEVSILAEDNQADVFEKLKVCAVAMLLELIPMIFIGNYQLNSQDEKHVSFANIINKKDEKLNFNQDAISVNNQLRALNPKPGCYFIVEQMRYKIYQANVIKLDEEYIAGEVISVNIDGIVIACKKNAIKIIKIQPSGKKIMNVEAFINGYKVIKRGQICNLEE